MEETKEQQQLSEMGSVGWNPTRENPNKTQFGYSNEPMPAY